MATGTGAPAIDLVARIGLEYETLVYAADDDMKKAFQLEANSSTLAFGKKNYLNNTILHLHKREGDCAKHGAENDVIMANVLAQYFNDRVDGQTKSHDNTHFFMVTDGYKMDPCLPPNSVKGPITQQATKRPNQAAPSPNNQTKSQIQASANSGQGNASQTGNAQMSQAAPQTPPQSKENPHVLRAGDTLDTKYTWVVTQDSSVKFVDKEYDSDDDETEIDPKFYTAYESDKAVREHELNMPLPKNTTANANVQKRADIRKHTVEGVEIVSPPLIVDNSNTIETNIGALMNMITAYEETQTQSSTPPTQNGQPQASKKPELTFFNCKKTSNHVHISFAADKTSDFPLPIWVTDPKQLVKICMAWWYFEPVFFMLCGYWRRSNDYAKGMARIMEEKYSDELRKTIFTDITAAKFFEKYNEIYGDELRINADKVAKLSAKSGTEKISEKYETIDFKRFANSDNLLKLMKIIYFFQGHPGDRSARYAGLNLLNTITKVGTVEVRIKQGTTDQTEIVNWIRLIEAFFRKVLILGDTVAASTFKDITVIRSGSNVSMQEILWKLSNLVFDKPGYDKLSIPTRNGLNSDMRDAFASLMNFVYGNTHDSVRKFWEARFEANMVAPQGTSSGGAKSVKGASASPKKAKKGAAKTAEKFKLFCYGSNGTKQLTERVEAQPGELVASAAYVKGYTRIFAGYSERWDGGVASIHPCDKSRVYGSVVELTEKQLKKLDRYEGGYTRTSIDVYAGRGSPAGKCFVYIKDNHTFVSPPSDAYLKAIRTMLDETKSGAKTNININVVIKDCKVGEKIKTIGKYCQAAPANVKSAQHKSKK
jgi:gamma-glutamylcyclotransferase (GGCT)/AIG2-like uncharacterized protein YtfP